MRFALVNGERFEAFKGGVGICPNCKSEVIARCGSIRMHHWSHKGNRVCDLWWENETPWHRNWKNLFLEDWQEVVHYDDSGEKHVADVKTENGWVIEFQYSYITAEERKSRNDFYKKIIWVVNGTRRKTDLVQFNEALRESKRAPVGNVDIRQINYPEETRLLREWNNSGVPVFFDFEEYKIGRIWLLLPNISKDKAYLIPFVIQDFIEAPLKSRFDELFNKIVPNIRNIILEYERSVRNRATSQLLNRRYRNKPKRRF